MLPSQFPRVGAQVLLTDRALIRWLRFNGHDGTSFSVVLNPFPNMFGGCKDRNGPEHAEADDEASGHQHDHEVLHTGVRQ